MGLFWPSKIKITPHDFVKTQLDKIFSPIFIDTERKKFTRLSTEIVLLQRISVEVYLYELQNVVYNLFQIAWDRNSPFEMFSDKDFDMKQSVSSLIYDEPRVKAIDSKAYDFSLSKAQQAGMDTFEYIATVFFNMISPFDVDKNDPDVKKFIYFFNGTFTNLYVGFEKLIKKQIFIK